MPDRRLDGLKNRPEPCGESKLNALQFLKPFKFTAHSMLIMNECTGEALLRSAMLEA
jgi:hypothetical protein